MSSVSIRKTAVAGGEREVFIAKTWTRLTLHLESNALGDNTMGYGATRTEFMPGETRTMDIAPGTRVTVETTSATPVEWGIHLTEMTWIDDVVQALCSSCRS